MSGTITPSFVKQYQTEVQEAYQRMGSKLRPTVRSATGVRGATAVFQRVGRGAASTKAQNGPVPTMSIDHSAIDVTLADFYAGDWIDRLDELKVNHDERTVVANAGAYALGRKTDEQIIEALNATTVVVAEVTGNSDLSNTVGLTRDKVLVAFEKLGAADVPDDGNRFAVVGWKQWSDLLKLQEFANADYIGDDQLPWKGTQAKRWLGALWIPHSGLPLQTLSGNPVRSCFFYHKTAIGHAVGAEITTDISWHGDHAAWFVNSMMSQGASMIDETGVVRMLARE